MAVGNKSSDYAGKDILEELDGASNYINSIIALILHHCDGNGEKAHLVDFGAGIGSYARRIHELGRNVSCIEVDPACRKRIYQKGLPVYPSLQEFQQSFAGKKNSSIP